jgi:hypothetical protein
MPQVVGLAGSLTERVLASIQCKMSNDHNLMGHTVLQNIAYNESLGNMTTKHLYAGNTTMGENVDAAPHKPC